MSPLRLLLASVVVAAITVQIAGAVCLDGVLDPGEACDPGRLAYPEDGEATNPCTNNCTVVDPLFACLEANTTCVERCAPHGIYSLLYRKCVCDSGFASPVGLEALSCEDTHVADCSVLNNAESEWRVGQKTVEDGFLTLELTANVLENYRTTQIIIGEGGSECQYPGLRWSKSIPTAASCRDVFTVSFPVDRYPACSVEGEVSGSGVALDGAQCSTRPWLATLTAVITTVTESTQFAIPPLVESVTVTVTAPWPRPLGYTFFMQSAVNLEAVTTSSKWTTVSNDDPANSELIFEFETWSYFNGPLASLTTINGSHADALLVPMSPGSECNATVAVAGIAETACVQAWRISIPTPLGCSSTAFAPIRLLATYTAASVVRNDTFSLRKTAGFSSCDTAFVRPTYVSLDSTSFLDIATSIAATRFALGDTMYGAIDLRVIDAVESDVDIVLSTIVLSFRGNGEEVLTQVGVENLSFTTSSNGCSRRFQIVLDTAFLDLADVELAEGASITVTFSFLAFITMTIDGDGESFALSDEFEFLVERPTAMDTQSTGVALRNVSTAIAVVSFVVFSVAIGLMFVDLYRPRKKPKVRVEFVKIRSGGSDDSRGALVAGASSFGTSAATSGATSAATSAFTSAATSRCTSAATSAGCTSAATSAGCTSAATSAAATSAQSSGGDGGS